MTQTQYLKSIGQYNCMSCIYKLGNTKHICYHDNKPVSSDIVCDKFVSDITEVNRKPAEKSLTANTGGGVDLRLVSRARLVELEDNTYKTKNKAGYNHARSLLPVYEQRS